MQGCHSTPIMLSVLFYVEHFCTGELLDTLPPGIDEAVAISKVVQFLKSPEYSHFQHIVFDTAPTGHTLRLLTLPDFLDKTIGGQENTISGCSFLSLVSPR